MVYCWSIKCFCEFSRGVTQPSKCNSRSGIRICQKVDLREHRGENAQRDRRKTIRGPCFAVDLGRTCGPGNLEKVEQAARPTCISREHQALIISCSVAGNPNHPEKRKIEHFNNCQNKQSSTNSKCLAMKVESDKGWRLLCQNRASNLSEPDLLNVTDFSSLLYLQPLEAAANDAMQIKRSHQNYAYGLMDEVVS